MKKTLLSTVSIVLSILFVFCFVSCDKKVDAEGLWENATYLSDTNLGKGEKTVSFTVEAGDQSITITIKTDKDTLGEAMYAEKLINDPTFFDTLNGIVASWDKDQAYWAFYEGDTLPNYGVDTAPLQDGMNYKLVYTEIDMSLFEDAAQEPTSGEVAVHGGGDN